MNIVAERAGGASDQLDQIEIELRDGIDVVIASAVIVAINEVRDVSGDGIESIARKHGVLVIHRVKLIRVVDREQQ